jgi:hypothetical protein
MLFCCSRNLKRRGVDVYFSALFFPPKEFQQWLWLQCTVLNLSTFMSLLKNSSVPTCASVIGSKKFLIQGVIIRVQRFYATPYCTLFRIES